MPENARRAESSSAHLFRQESHVGKLRANLDTSGEASLQNAIQLAVDSLATIPPYGHREVGGCRKHFKGNRIFYCIPPPLYILYNKWLLHSNGWGMLISPLYASENSVWER